MISCNLNHFCCFNSRSKFRIINILRQSISFYLLSDDRISMRQRKWWGSKNQRPILCVHGWQDNANSFNTLIPLLTNGYSYLAIDLPGHGLSSHLPPGCFYSVQESVTIFRRIQLYFGWPKVSLIGHSYGAACGSIFCACFSNDVDFFVAIDNIKPLPKNPKQEIREGSKTIEKMLSYDTRTTESPMYSKSEVMERWIKGSDNSVTEKSCEILLERGADIENGLYKIRRDSKVKKTLMGGFTQKEILKLSESIKCNVLFIKAKDSSYFEAKQNVLDVMNIVKSNAKYFEYQEFPGTHHLHLNNPEVVAPVINSFIKTVECQN